MSRLEVLLDLQTCDTELAQLRHRRDSLPERGALDESERQVARIGADLEQRRAVLVEAERAMKRADDELTIAGDRVSSIEGRLSGVTVPREAEALQADRAHAARRRGELEDVVLEAMEAVEAAELDVAATVADLDDATAVRDKAAAALTVAAAEVDVELERAAGDRERAQAAVADELLGVYERVRSRVAVAVARLEHGTCQGCHLALPATELDAIRHQPDDAVVYCDSCGCVLVR